MLHKLNGPGSRRNVVRTQCGITLQKQMDVTNDIKFSGLNDQYKFPAMD